MLGLFTWNDDDPAYFHRELDIEFSRWGDASDPSNAQYVVQPWAQPGNLLRFTQPARLARSTHSFRWLAGSAFFQSLRGHQAAPPDPSYVIAEWATTQSIPPAGGEHARMNLWLAGGAPPDNERAVEVVVSRFEFVPTL